MRKYGVLRTARVCHPVSTQEMLPLVFLIKAGKNKTLGRLVFLVVQGHCKNLSWLLIQTHLFTGLSSALLQVVPCMGTPEIWLLQSHVHWGGVV